MKQDPPSYGDAAAAHLQGIRDRAKALSIQDPERFVIEHTCHRLINEYRSARLEHISSGSEYDRGRADEARYLISLLGLDEETK